MAQRAGGAVFVRTEHLALRTNDWNRSPTDRCWYGALDWEMLTWSVREATDPAMAGLRTALPQKVLHVAPVNSFSNYGWIELPVEVS